MKSGLLKNCIFSVNLLIIFSFFVILMKIQKFSVMTAHDIFMPFIFDIKNSAGRLIGDFIAYLLNNYLPAFFNLHPNDFRCSIGASILSLFFITISLLCSKLFFISIKNNQICFKYWEFIFIIIFSFYMLKLPFCYLFVDSDIPLMFAILDHQVIFCEYYLGLIPFIFSIYFLYEILILDKIIPFNKKILYSINFFIIAFWNEYLQVILALILSSALFLFKNRAKDLLKNNFQIILSFVIGAILFYIFSDYFSGQTIATYEYNIYDQFLKIPNEFNSYIKEYICFVIIQKLYLIIPIIIMLIYLKNKNTSKYTLSIILGCMLTLFLGIFMIDTVEEKYIFQKEVFNIIYNYILVFLCLILSGQIYFKNRNKSKIILFVSFFTITNIFFTLNAIKLYYKDIDLFKLKKITMYNIEERNTYFSLKKEFVKLPECYLSLDFINLPYINTKNIIDVKLSTDGFNTIFIEKYYNIKVIGYVFKREECNLSKKYDINNKILYDKLAFTKLRNNIKRTQGIKYE